MTTEGSPRAGTRDEVAVRRAGTNPAGLDAVEVRLRAALAGGGAPRWLSQVAGGVPDLECDTLGPDEDAVRLRESFRNAGRLLSILFAEQDRQLEPARTGRLVRMALVAERGAGYCYSVVPSQHVVGFLPGAVADIAAAEAAMVRLVDLLRRDVGLRTQNPGGLAAPRRTAEVEVPPGDAGPEPDPPPFVTGDGAGALFDRALAALDGTVLHWLGHVREQTVVFAVDRFGDRRMARHFQLMSVPARRRFYTDFAEGVVALAGRLDRVARAPLGGPLDRLVLDVEQGALVVHRLGPREHLIGITLDQEQVARAERAVAALPGP